MRQLRKVALMTYPVAGAEITAVWPEEWGGGEHVVHRPPMAYLVVKAHWVLGDHEYVTGSPALSLS